MPDAVQDMKFKKCNRQAEKDIAMKGFSGNITAETRSNFGSS